jgi:uncharacterized membrane protein
MSKSVLKELSNLVAAQVISEDTAEKIKHYYEHQPNQSASRLMIVFGILGALLIGMGVVLIVAHNWDELPHAIKIAIGLTPLLVAQVMAAVAVFSRSESSAWREATSTGLFFAIAISISIVSQVYNIEGDLGGFLFIWMCLALPVVYVLRSSVASMLFIVGITWYGCEVGYFTYENNAIAYWVFLALIIPFYYMEFIKKEIKNNFFHFHSWLLALSVTICLGVMAGSHEELLMIGYMSLFSAFVSLSQHKRFDTGRLLSNAWLVTGSLGIIMLLLALSFDWYLDIQVDNSLFNAPEFFISIATTTAAAMLLYILLQDRPLKEINSKSLAFLAFIILFFTGVFAPWAAQLLVNVLVLAFAIRTIYDGARQNHLGILNYGLLIITALITSRFFDTDFSFVVRGLLFIGVGIGFFAANYYMIQKRKKVV